MADLRFAAWFLWMTPLLAALSSSRDALRKADVVASASPASAASRNRRTAVLSSLLTALLRRRRRSFVPIRLIWLLMLATRDLPQSSGVRESIDKASSWHEPVVPARSCHHEMC